MIEHENISRRYGLIMHDIEKMYEDGDMIPQNIMVFYRACALIYYRNIDAYIDNYGPLPIDINMLDEAKRGLFQTGANQFEVDAAQLLNKLLDEMNSARRGNFPPRASAAPMQIASSKVYALPPTRPCSTPITQHQGTNYAKHSNNQ